MAMISMSNLPSRKKKGQTKRNNIVRMSDIPSHGVTRELPKEPSKKPSQERYLYTQIPHKPWKGRRCFVVGGGPSLKGFDFSRLNGELVIAVNRSWEVTNHSIHFFLDEQFWGWLESGDFGKDLPQRYIGSPSYKVTTTFRPFPYPREVSFVDYIPRAAFPESITKGIYMGCNSGFGAVNLAIALGAKDVYLLGFDADDTKPYEAIKHFHNGYPNKVQNHTFGMFQDNFREMKGYLTKDVNVYNMNKNSKITYFPFRDWRNVKKKKRPLVVSFYTPEYKEIAQDMHKSANLFGFETDIVPIEKKGTWTDMAYYKATFMRDKLREHKRDILWLDADSVVFKYPELFDNFKSDVGVHYKDGKELLSAVVYLSYNDKVLELMDIWQEKNKTMPKQVCPQKCLQAAIKDWTGEVTDLPKEYCKICDIMKGDPIIEQRQASRKFGKDRYRG